MPRPLVLAVTLVFRRIDLRKREEYREAEDKQRDQT
jgi:hypothetical protein